MDAPDSYVWLDAAQLIKHAFGLAHTFRDRPTTLLYLFWEPLHPDACPEFSAHRAEIAAFAERVKGAGPRFVAMSYPELWEGWAQTGPDWLTTHLADLWARYLVAV